MKKLILVIMALIIVLSACTTTGPQPALIQNPSTDTPVEQAAAATSTLEATQASTVTSMESTATATATNKPVATQTRPLPTATDPLCNRAGKFPIHDRPSDRIARQRA